MREPIIDFLTLDGQYTRSISLDRDLNDDRVIENYLLTPNSIGAIRQISEGLISGQAQRAWKIVGPYGSGKSALGVMLAQLMIGPNQHPSAAKSLEDKAPEIADYFSTSRRYVLAVVGSRVSFGAALTAVVTDAIETFGKKKAFLTLSQQFDLAKSTYKGLPLNSVTGEIASDFADALLTVGYQGLTILIDEVGKFIEHAALYPEQGDLIAIQQIAETACKVNDNKLAVVAMLHQHFASYAAGVGRALNDEWHKVSARFAEITFDEPVERYAYFARHALGMKSKLLDRFTLTAESRAIYAKALSLGILSASSTTDKDFFKSSEYIYPLHPLTLAALAIVSKRYGQSERTFLSFLKGSESNGLRDFAQQNSIGTWYRLTDLYDFLSEGYGLHFRDLSVERRWIFAQDSIQRITQDPATLNVLKVIAIIELIQGGMGFAATLETIEYALGLENTGNINDILSDLVKQGVLVRRRRNKEYTLAVSDAINIEALYEEAARNNESELILNGINAAFSQRLIVANRHYNKTGTIRTLGTLVGTPDIWPTKPKNKTHENKVDGWIRLILVTKGTDAEQQALQRIQKEKDHFSIDACIALSSEGKSALADYAIWQNIMHEVSSKRLDPWTNSYVEGRLKEAGNIVERLVTSALLPSEERPGPFYWHLGQVVQGSEQMNASQLASWLFDKVYYQSPCIINELINKDKPASAIVLARQRIFEILLAGDTSRPICGDSEYPPERLIHTTLLRDTGIWQENHGQWSLHTPNASAKNNISTVWKAISDSLGKNEPQSYSKVLDILAEPPLGVRAGPASVWIVLYLLINRARCAIFERGSLVLEFTVEHLQRMYKNPQNFTLRELLDVTESTKLLSDYRDILSTIGCTLDKNATYLDVARTLILWFIRLPDFSKQTQRIGKDAILVRSMLSKATDPIALLTQTLPRLHIESKSKEPFLKWLAAALSNLGMAYRKLQDEVTTELSNGFNINGSLSRVRNQLQAECTKEGSKLADTKLRSFILRCTDLVLSDEKWLDSVGSLIAQRPLDGWTDDTLSYFQEGLSDLCGRYQRWMQVVMHRGIAPREADRFVGLTLTMVGGEESAVFVSTSDSSATLAKNILALVTESAKDNPQLAAAALAQAIIELKIVSNVKPKKEEGMTHG